MKYIGSPYSFLITFPCLAEVVSLPLTMAETQLTEYKESWRDEYLKWIAGFANAQGGTLLIGIDDKGQVVGVDNAKRLLGELPKIGRAHV